MSEVSDEELAEMVDRRRAALNYWTGCKQEFPEQDFGEKIAWMQKDLSAMEELQRARKYTSQFPVTADGVRIGPGDEYWVILEAFKDPVCSFVLEWHDLEDKRLSERFAKSRYSTKEAAEAARKDGGR